jgi:hypothetical protein
VVIVLLILSILWLCFSIASFVVLTESTPWNLWRGNRNPFKKGNTVPEKSVGATLQALPSDRKSDMAKQRQNYERLPKIAAGIKTISLIHMIIMAVYFPIITFANTQEKIWFTKVAIYNNAPCV